MLYPAELWVRVWKSLFSAGLANTGGLGCQAFAGTKRQNAAQRGTVMAHFTAQWLKGAGCVGVLALVQCSSPAPAAAPGKSCAAVSVIDGDTISCATGAHIRLASIDAPEMPGHCRTGRECTPGDPFASKRALQSLVAGKAVSCVHQGTDHYRRIIGRCYAGRTDLSCAMVASGHAVRRYGALRCR